MKILVVSSGSGGHVYPALSVARQFKKSSYEVCWLGRPNSLETKLCKDEGIEFFSINSYGFRGKNFLHKVLSIFTLITAFLSSLYLIIKLKPNLLFSTGNHSSLGPCLGAVFLGVPIFIHEQNSIPGTANKILSRFAFMVFEGFENSFLKSEKVYCVGNPIREEFNKNIDKKKKNKKKLENRILILGGSQGSSQINEMVGRIFSHQLFDKDIFIHHQVGQGSKETIELRYKTLGLKYLVEEYIEDISSAMLDSDVIISRSGAMTISEISFSSKPSILIPLPWSIDNHQLKNSEYMKKKGASIVFLAKNLDISSLVYSLLNLIEDQQRLEEMGKLAKLAFRPNSTLRIFKYIDEAITK